jgi:hypothetical protein
MGALLALPIVYTSENDQSPNWEDIIIDQAAPRDIRASHTFAVVQVNTTDLEESQRQAASQVLSVWDWNEDLSSDVNSRIEYSFHLMRRKLADFANNVVLPPTNNRENLQVLPRTDELIEDSIGPDSDVILSPDSDLYSVQAPAENAQNDLLVILSDPVFQLTDAEMEDFVEEHSHHFSNHLRVSLEEEFILPLAQLHFSSEVEAEIQRLVGQILSLKLIDRYSVDDLIAQQERGIVLRRIRGGETVSEVTISDFSAFLGADQASNQIMRQLDELPLDVSEETQDSIVETAIRLINNNPNCHFSPGETGIRERLARNTVEPTTTTTTFRNNALLLSEGQIVTEQLYQTIQIMTSSDQSSEQKNINEVIVGGVIYILIVLFGLMTYGDRFIRRFNPNLRDLICMSAILLVMLSLTRGMLILGDVFVEQMNWIPLTAYYAAIPFAAGAMLVRIVLNAESALIYSITYSLLVLIMIPEHPIFGAYALIGSLSGTGAVEVVNTRITLFKGGIVVSMINLAFALSIVLLGSQLLTLDAIFIALMAFSGGIFVAILVTGLLPVLESTFKYISDFKLLELSNPNHPALRELLLHAPGSYQHSMAVASLVEAACKSIGANTLLGRVGCYYHDIGKAKNAHYFAENQRGKNPHDKLKPHMSALIIKSHVKDGVDMAIRYGLPREIIRFIDEHHGTSQISFFYHKAKELEDPEIQEVNEKDFRYPGPKPQTTETAICLLADGIEAASRAMQDPTPARLQGLVQRMVNQAFTDGQLDECDLTLRDLDAIAREFIRILLSFYHRRPEYPDSKKENNQASTKSTEVSEKEFKDVGGNSDQELRTKEEPRSKRDSNKGTATLKRLGIDKIGTFDPPNK